MLYTAPNGTQYLIVIGLDQSVLIYKRAVNSSTWGTGFDLGTIAGNPLDIPTVDPDVVGLQEASHFIFSLAVDANGFIHIVGNMHNTFPRRYVRSTNPHDITAWTDGNAFIDDSALAFDFYTYNRFTALSDGTLLWVFHGTFGGVIGVSARRALFRLNPGDTDWEPFASDGLFMTCNTTAGDSDPDRAYHSVLYTDLNDTVHFVGLWQMLSGDDETRGNVFYVRSTDRGVTWKTVNGTAITPPFTLAMTTSTSACQVYADPATVTNGFDVDENGPHISVGAETNGLRFSWSGSAWTSVVESPLIGGHTIINHRYGGMWRIRSASGTFRIQSDDTSQRVDFGHETGGGWTPVLDPTLQQRGIAAFAYPRDDDSPRVYTFGGGYRTSAI